jgi:hypothetical protein
MQRQCKLKMAIVFLPPILIVVVHIEAELHIVGSGQRP